VSYLESIRKFESEKKISPDVKASKQWNPDQAEACFTQALERTKNIYVTGSIPWAEKHCPDLVEAIHRAEQQFDRAYRAGDMAGCRKAAQAFERAIRDVVTAYREQRVLSADEITQAFQCERTWQLPADKAATLDEVFSSPQAVVDAGGGRWYSPEGWRMDATVYQMPAIPHRTGIDWPAGPRSRALEGGRQKGQGHPAGVAGTKEAEGVRIAITGTHGTGKTTLATELAQKLGLPLITEQARRVARVMGIVHARQLVKDKALARRFQKAVLREQIRAENDCPDGFISDRSTLDCWAYWAAYGLGNDPEYRDLCLSRPYDLLVYVPLEIPCQADGFRDTDESLRQLVDRFIQKDLLWQCRCPVLPVTGSPEERVKAVLEWLKGGNDRARPLPR
jgi:nicotinamide riboside kinase